MAFLHQDWSLPVVAETWDGWLNDINGFHVKPEDVFAALDSAKAGPVPEGNTGGGTGMVCYGFKGGTGTASRVLAKEQGGYTVGVLVQCNCGRRPQLTIAGVPVGKEIPGNTPYAGNEHPGANIPGSGPPTLATTKNRKDGARNESANGDAGNDVPSMNAVPPGSENRGRRGLHHYCRLPPMRRCCRTS